MENYYADTYGERAAEEYDRSLAFKWKEVPEVVAVLAELAAGGPALDVGVGTGRIAYPLARAGVRVVGVDVSAAMLAKAEQVRGDVDLPLVLSDVAAEPIDGTYTLIYAVFNTFFTIGDRERQVSFLRHAFDALRPGGRLLLEAFVPKPETVGTGRQRVGVSEMHGDRVALFAVVHRHEQQLLENQEIVFDDRGVRLKPVRFHYHTAAQVDALAVAAGFSVDQHCAGWSREPLDDSADNMVLLYRKDGSRED